MEEIATEPPSEPRWMATACVALLLLGAGLRTAQWGFQGSLWVDEIALTMDLERRDAASLASEPPALHMTPLGFCLAQRGVIVVAGARERAVRFLPYLASLASLLLFAGLARRFVRGLGLVAAVALFSLSPPLVFQAGYAKPYATDLAASLLLVWLGLRLRERSSFPRAVVGGTIGLVVLQLSFTAVLVAFAVGLGLTLEALVERSRERLTAVAVLGAGWGLGAAVATWLSLRLTSPAIRAFLDQYWAHSFPPPPWQSVGAALWVPRQLLDAFAHFLLFLELEPTLRFTAAAVPAILVVLGLAALLPAERWGTLLLVAPPAAGLVALAGHVLPMRGRLALYAMWPLAILAGAGVEAIAGASSTTRRRLVAAAAALALVAPAAASVLVVARPPYHAQEAGPVLAELARRRSPGDGLYVYCGAQQAIRFYGRRSGLASWVEGGCYGRDLAPLERELDAFRGRRVWLFVTQENPVYREPERMRAYLTGLGPSIDRIPDPYGLVGPNAAWAELFDLRAAPPARDQPR